MLKSPSTPAEHVALVDSWIGVLSGLGIFARNLPLTLKRKQLAPSVPGAELAVWKLHIYYGGHELGDAAYLTGRGAGDGPETSVSDVGFGLEQLAWVLAGGRHADLLGPWPFALRVEPRVVDAVRTLALLIGCGGRPGGRSAGQRIRLLAKQTAPYLPELPTGDLARCYHEFGPPSYRCR